MIRFNRSVIVPLMFLLIWEQNLNSENSFTENVTFNDENFIQHYYNGLQSNGELPEYSVFYLGLKGYFNLMDSITIENKKYFTLIDFNLSSVEKRLWVFDLYENKILYHCHVAHGKNSGELYARYFSNRPTSNQSSPGFYLTDNVYVGKHGLSLRLDGLEKGLNDNAWSRAIVMHAASYVSERFIQENGRLGRSFGCPAIPESICADLIHSIKNKSVLFIFTNQENYPLFSNVLKYQNQDSFETNFAIKN